MTLNMPGRALQVSKLNRVLTGMAACTWPHSCSNLPAMCDHTLLTATRQWLHSGLYPS